jgi:hypothetical protein
VPRRGQSLQQYLTTELSRVAQSPTIAEVLELIVARPAALGSPKPCPKR